MVSYKALRIPVPRSPTYPTEFPLLYFHVGELVLPVMNALHVYKLGLLPSGYAYQRL